jgi:orotidine-5'-phosphate decarboxylase
MSFLRRLADSSRARDSIVCVGLDPEPDRIPSHLGNGAQAAGRFLTSIIRATSDRTCAYKPNLAFFEQYGKASAELLAAALEAVPEDVPVILDAKRGDIGNTASAYARSLFEVWRADAVTVAPYVGLDSVAAFTERGYVFVLARTSNAGAGDVQDLRVDDGRPVYEHVVEKCVARFSAEQAGFVVGATYPAEAARLRRIAPDRLFLMPGIGAQGGALDEALGAALDARGGGVLLSASRSVLYASPGHDFEVAAARSLKELVDAANEARLVEEARLVGGGARGGLPPPRCPFLMFGIGTGELLLILLIALIVLGPERMPQIARDLGRIMGDLRRTSDELQRELLNADRPPVPPAPPTSPPPAAIESEKETPKQG